MPLYLCVCRARQRHRQQWQSHVVLYANRFWTKAKVIHEIFKSVIQFLLSIMMILYFLFGVSIVFFLSSLSLPSSFLSFFVFSWHFCSLSALDVCVCCFVPKIEYPSGETFRSIFSIGINSLSSCTSKLSREHLNLSID